MSKSLGLGKKSRGSFEASSNNFKLYLLISSLACIFSFDKQNSIHPGTPSKSRRNREILLVSNFKLSCFNDGNGLASLYFLD